MVDEQASSGYKLFRTKRALERLFSGVLVHVILKQKSTLKSTRHKLIKGINNVYESKIRNKDVGLPMHRTKEVSMFCDPMIVRNFDSGNTTHTRTLQTTGLVCR